MRLERNVWKLGEKIPVHIECSVKGGSTKVDKVSLLCNNKLGYKMHINVIKLSSNNFLHTKYPPDIGYCIVGSRSNLHLQYG